MNFKTVRKQNDSVHWTFRYKNNKERQSLLQKLYLK